MGRRRSVALALVLMLVAAVAAVGCEWIPPPTFYVDSGDPYRDGDPGDGLCKTSETGLCTLSAAVDEANASGLVTEIIVPDGTYTLALGITGKVRINWGNPGVVRIRDLSVGAGGEVKIDGLTTFLQNTVVVNGVLVARHSSFAPFSTPLDAALRVGASGIVVLQNSNLQAVGGPAIVNEGRLVLSNVTVTSAGVPPIFALTGPTLVTQGAGSTTLTATILNADPGDGSLPGPSVQACGGTAPVSSGYNAAFDLSCGLTAVGDQQGVPFTLATDVVNIFAAPKPKPGSPLIDAIPAGADACVSSPDDVWRHPRPVDGDGSGTAACDIGAVEVPAA